ncbi:uncharacterized protein ACOB7L_026722 [Callospermophilus lateralis]
MGGGEEEGDKVKNAAATSSYYSTSARQEPKLVSHLPGPPGEMGRGDGDRGQGAVALPLGAGQRVEGDPSQQPLIGSCSLVAFPDWTICSGRCCEARRGGASRPRSKTRPWSPVGRDGARLCSGCGAAVTCRETQPPFLNSASRSEAAQRLWLVGPQPRWKGVSEDPSRPGLILLQRRFPGTVLFKTENIQSQSLPWGGEGKEVEWEEVDPGRKKREIRPRETAPRGCGARRFCHLAIAGAEAGPRPGPARRGESPAAAAPPHALPRRPRARGRPGQVAAVLGSGRPGAAASERSGGQRRLVLPLGSAGAAVRNALSGCRQRGAGSTRPASSGACFLFRFSREGRALAGLWRARVAAGSPPSRHLNQCRSWRGAAGSLRRASGGGGGAAPACAEPGRAGGRREGHKGRWRAPGSGRTAVEEGRLGPLMNINRACGLAPPGRARRPARVPAPAGSRAGQLGPSGREGRTTSGADAGATHWASFGLRS